MTTAEEVFEMFRDAARSLDAAVADLERGKRLVMGSAYQMAIHLRNMLHEDEGELMSRINADYPDSEKSVEAWLDDSFAELTALGESYTDLFRAIEEGTTIEQYAGVGVEQEMRDDDAPI